MENESRELVSLYALVGQLLADAREAVKRGESGATDFYVDRHNLYLEKTKQFFRGGLVESLQPLTKVGRAFFSVSGDEKADEIAKMQEIVAALGQLVAFLYSKLPHKEQERLGFIKD